MTVSRLKSAQDLVHGELQRGAAAVAQVFSFTTPRRLVAELAIVLILGSACAAFAVHQFGQFDFIRLCRGIDLWFDSDPARTVHAVSTRWSDFHARSNLHPLWSLFVAAPIGTAGQLVGLSARELMTLYVALQSACLGAAAYLALRAFKLPRVDAVLGVLVLFSTAAVIYWIGVPEWFAFGAASVIASVIWIAAPAQAQTHVTGVAQSVISASMAATSWTFGIAAVLLARWPRLRWRPTFEQTRDALAVLGLLTIVQYLVFPRAGGFFAIWAQVQGLNHADHSLIEYLAAFFGHTLIAPTPTVLEGVKPEPGFFRVMSSQHQPVALSPLTLTIVSLWTVLIALGARAALAGAVSRPAALLVAGGLGFFFLFHMIYGVETFLFALLFAPFMTFVALWGAATKLRLAVRGLCLALCAASLAYNYPAFQAAVGIHNAIDPSWLEGLGAISNASPRIACE